jgi:NAD(P)-dependent dehydrogenase (short-subunit alcohol dehydrogenase family)
MNYKDKTVVVTGGAKGIGAATAKVFFDAGANVAILDIAADTSNIQNEKWMFLQCDVSNETQVAAAFERISKQFNTIDFLVNNAGIQRYGTVTETSTDEWDLVMNINLKSFFLCAKYALPLMQKNQKGAIINVASVQAFLSQQNVAAYTTAKSAILGLTRSIAVDYAPNIRCVAVCPGTIDTPMLRDAIALSPDPAEVMQECVDMHLTKRIGTAEEVAELILYLCDDKASFITGQAIRIDGGLGITIQGSKR